MLFRPLLSATLACLVLAAPLLAAPVLADDVRQSPKAVVELFTSQGCSNCPAADAMLVELGKRPDIIALAYHVDYWDYRGWPDTFGAEDNSNRQRDYAASWGSSRIFTPQMVVNGTKGVVASRKGEVQTAVGNAALELPVSLVAKGDMLEISIAGDAEAGPGVVWLITFLDEADVEIERGENQGKTITYTQIVTGRQAVGMWEPVTGTQLKLPLSEVLTEKSNGAVIMVQQEKAGLPGKILGAASFTR